MNYCNGIFSPSEKIAYQVAARAASNLKLSEQLAIVCKGPVPSEFCRKNSDRIRQLMSDVGSMNLIIKKLQKPGIDPGVCKITTEEKKVVDTYAKIQSNLNQDVVVAALRALGITPNSSQAAPLSNMWSKLPSKNTLFKVALVIASIACLAALTRFFNKTETESFKKGLSTEGITKEVQECLTRAYVGDWHHINVGLNCISKVILNDQSQKTIKKIQDHCTSRECTKPQLSKLGFSVMMDIHNCLESNTVQGLSRVIHDSDVRKCVTAFKQFYV